MSNKEIYNPSFRRKVLQSYYRRKVKHWSDKAKGLPVGKEITLPALQSEFKLTQNQLVRLLYYKQKALHENER